jgi:predicted GH43/DUF377 family glycosyl hydrolase
MDILAREAGDSTLWESSSLVKRYKFNPILEAIKEHFWESKMVYNAAAFKLDNVTYIVYRAFGHDHISRLGLAWTVNGVDIVGRLSFPIFEPTQNYEYPSEENKALRPREKGGCEDPRISVIDDKIYMVYTAYSRLCQTAIASIGIAEFKKLIEKSAFGDYKDSFEIREKWDNTWDRHGLVFPENVEKEVFSRNACVFPVKLDGKVIKYALIYRLQTSQVMIAYSDKPIGPWKEHSVFVESTEPWEGERMGICSPPVITDKGLFFVYHGVDEFEKNNVRRNYRLGGLFLEFSNDNGSIKHRVTKIKKPILSPERGYEEQSDWLESRNVFAVFSCAALPFGNIDKAEENDEIIIYYGAGDVRICAAKVKCADLIKAVF